MIYAQALKVNEMIVKKLGLIIEKMAAGMTVKQAMDFVMGPDAYDQFVDVLYLALREKAGVK